MTKSQFMSEGEELGKKAGTLHGAHAYFKLHASRLHQCCELFGLFTEKLGDVLEIGSFYGYTPFLLRKRARPTRFRRTHPAVRPLEPLYKEHDITLFYVDLFDVFGPTRSSSHRLTFPDSSFDTILCWETMEHFNFNPVKFVGRT